MNKSQENKLRMYLLVEKVCNENAAAWNEFQPFAKTVKKLTEHVGQINAARQKQEQNYKGVTDDKEILQEKLVHAALKHVSALKVYATLENNQTLLQKISFTRHMLTRTRVTTVIDRCSLIYNESVANLEQLLVFSITRKGTKELKELISQFRNMFTESNECRNERSLATEKLKDLLKETDYILKTQLDNLMYFYKETNPDFYYLYKNSRKIIRYGVRYENENQEQGDLKFTSQTGTQSQAA